jgi:hypothetical protein
MPTHWASKECRCQFYRNTNLLGKIPGSRDFHSDAEALRFDIIPGGQQVHIAFGPNDLKSRRHPCFKLESPQALLELRNRIWEHFEKAEKSSPQEADKPGEVDSGTCLSHSRVVPSLLCLLKYANFGSGIQVRKG